MSRETLYDDEGLMELDYSRRGEDPTSPNAPRQVNISTKERLLFLLRQHTDNPSNRDGSLSERFDAYT